MSMELSRKIVEVFYRKREESGDYIVRLDIQPNPLNFDGIDEVEAMVLRQDKVSFQIGVGATYSDTVVLRTGATPSVEEALSELWRRARLVADSRA